MEKRIKWRHLPYKEMAQPLFWTGCEEEKRGREAHSMCLCLCLVCILWRAGHSFPSLSRSFFLSLPLFVLICCPSISPWFMILIQILTKDPDWILKNMYSLQVSNRSSWLLKLTTYLINPHLTMLRCGSLTIVLYPLSSPLCVPHCQVTSSILLLLSLLVCSCES